MADEDEGLTRKERTFLRDLLITLSLLLMFIIGFWMLEQTMNSVVILKRDFVDLAFDRRMDVWRYHDISYGLLWVSYVGFVLREITPWRKGELTSSGVIISLLGFASLTAGLFLSQDTMNAVLILDRACKGWASKTYPEFWDRTPGAQGAPSGTLLQVSRLGGKDFLVEIEVFAAIK